MQFLVHRSMSILYTTSKKSIWLIFIHAFIPVYFFLLFFYHWIPHFIHPMKNNSIYVNHSNHLLNRFSESKNIGNIILPRHSKYNLTVWAFPTWSTLYDVHTTMLRRDFLIRLNFLSMIIVEVNRVLAIASDFRL